MRTPLILAFVAAASVVSACRSGGATPPPPTPPPIAAPAVPPPAPAPPAAPAKAGARVEVAVTEEGFVPSRIPAHQGKPLTLAVTRKTDRTCAREIMFQGQEGKTVLPLNKTVEITYTPKVSGNIRFGCAMGMMVSGVLAVSD
jgi:hypothetical protein